MSNQPPPQTPQTINIPLFVFQIDVVLLSLFALYVVLTLPRSLVRLFQHSEISNGFFLRSGTAPHSLRQLISRAHNSSDATKTKPIHLPITLTSPIVDTVVDPPEYSVEGIRRNKSCKAHRAFTIPPRATPAADTKGSFSRHVPTRVLRWTRILHPTLAYAFNFRVAPGISFGNLLVFLVYNALILYAALRRPDPLVNPQRIGYLAISQVPIAMILAGKTNWLTLACGVGYEKLIYIHKIVGHAIIILVNFHGLTNFYRWSLTGTTRSSLFMHQNLWGLVALCAVDLLFLSSLSFVRKRMYGIFITIHTTCFMVILFATYHHRSACVPFVQGAVVLYAFDHFARVVRTRHTTGWLTAEHALNRGTTLVHVPSLRAGWRAGQHVRVRVVSGGWLARLVTWFLYRARPFTIAAGPDSGGMMLQIRALGSWSRYLLCVAEDTDDVRLKEMSTSAERGRGSAREVRVIIEGPYGGPGYTVYTAYSGAVLVAGGSGISYVMGVLDDMLRNHASGNSHLRVIEVIWSISDPDSLYALLPDLTPLMRPRASYHGSLSLRFNVHWTRVSSYHPPRVPHTTLPTGMYIQSGRPDIFSALQSVIVGVRTAHYATGWSDDSPKDLPRGIVVGSCGPTALVDSAAQAVGRVNWADWKDLGGVESVEEVFEW